MIFAVLKFILKIILILLIILLALILILLFMRLKYTISGKYAESTEFGFKLSTLFGAVKLCYDSEEDTEPRLTVFGIGKKKKKPEESTETKDTDEPPAEEVSEDVSEEPVNKPEETEEDDGFEYIDEDTVSESDTEPTKKEKPVKEKPKKEKPKKEKKSVKEKPKKQTFLDKAKTNISKFNDFREKHDIPLLIKLALAYVWDQIKAFGIYGGRVDGILGLDDPSKTGMALGGIGAAGAFLPLDINIIGNFEKKEINAKGEIYGKTCIFKLLLPILKLILKKPVWALIKDLLFSTKGDKK